jgi:hypothetical protein
MFLLGLVVGTCVPLSFMSGQRRDLRCMCVPPMPLLFVLVRINPKAPRRPCRNKPQLVSFQSNWSGRLRRCASAIRISNYLIRPVWTSQFWSHGQRTEICSQIDTKIHSVCVDHLLTELVDDVVSFSCTYPSHPPCWFDAPMPIAVHGLLPILTGCDWRRTVTSNFVQCSRMHDGLCHGLIVLL